MDNRFQDKTLIQCLDCGWHGKQMDARHGYVHDRWDEVDPMDFCPQCGGDQLYDIQTLSDQMQNDFKAEGFK